MTLVLVFRHLCSELRSYKLERQDNQALLLWRQLNPPASLLPFRWYSCDTTHRGWRLLQAVARLGEHELLDILREIILLLLLAILLLHPLVHLLLLSHLIVYGWLR